MISLSVTRLLVRLTLRFSGSPTQLRIKATHRRVRCKRLFDRAVHLRVFGKLEL